MLGFLSNKKTMIFVVVVVMMLFLLLAGARGQYRFPVMEGVVSYVLSPFHFAISKVGFGVHGVFTSLGKLKDVYGENEHLRQEVLNLRQATVQLNELQAENQRLTQMLDYKRASSQYQLLPALVIARSPELWSNVIMINKGSADGITKDMSIVTPMGLVGNIINVYPHSAKVLLILDPKSAVGAIVQRTQSRVTGIVVGSTSSPNVPRMINLARDSDIVKGDIIITSGLGGIFPKGVVVGQVDEVKDEEGGLLKYAELKTAVEFNKLEEVFVITNVRPDPVPAMPDKTAKGAAK